MHWPVKHGSEAQGKGGGNVVSQFWPVKFPSQMQVYESPWFMHWPVKQGFESQGKGGGIVLSQFWPVKFPEQMQV